MIKEKVENPFGSEEQQATYTFNSREKQDFFDMVKGRTAIFQSWITNK